MSDKNLPENTQPILNWEDDILERKIYADFLSKYLTAKIKTKENRRDSFTMALDADWGQGKTFFIERWSRDLREANPPHIVVNFDAWRQDFGADPLVAFMAEINNALKKEIEKAKFSTQAKSAIDSQMKLAISGFRRAAVPVFTAISKSLLRNFTGIAADELIQFFKNEALGKKESEQKPLSEEISDTTKDGLNKGFEVLFEKVLEEQIERSTAINEFRKAMEGTLSLLSEEGGHSSVMFVFVDELDRCRPSFAIGLLEGLKHIFGVRGVCFVVSTNIEQLSHTVKSVYGDGFDGRGYLKRFFDAEYELPRVSREKYSEKLIHSHHLLNARSKYSAIPSSGLSGIETKSLDLVSIIWVCQVFDLSLRDEEQLIDMMEAASSGIPEEKEIHFLWLAILCATRRKHPSIFEKLADPFIYQESGFAKEWQSAVKNDFLRTYKAREGRDYVTKEITLLDITKIYYEISNTDLQDLNEKSNKSSNIYPESIKEKFKNEYPHITYLNQKYPTSIATYYNLVRNAGHFKDQQQA